MTKKEQLKNALKKFVGTDDTMLQGFKAFDDGVAKLKSDLQQKIKASTLDDVNTKLDDFSKKIDYQPLLDAFDKIKNEIVSRDTQLTSELETHLESLRGELSEARGTNKNSTTSLQEEIDQLNLQLAEVLSQKPPEFPDFLTPIKESETRITAIIDNLEKFDDKNLKTEIEKLDQIISQLKIELLTRINERGGGGMNRQIFVGGSNPLTKYTDINLKASSNTTITYAENNTTKKVDITISATGGGGGTVRSINSISTNTVAGATAGTDYVYICSGTINLTLPTAALNTNQYTIKNAGTGTITILPIGTDTLDNDISIIMPLRYTSVDLISDGVSNWNIT